MKTNFIKVGIAVMLSAVLLTACEKNSTENAARGNTSKESAPAPKRSPEMIKSLFADYLANHQQ